MQRVTHQDIAKSLGLSQSAVSRALADSPKIPLKTRQKIRALADKMGYRPNSLLSELAASRWQGKKLQGEVIAYIHAVRRDAVIGPDLSAALQRQALLLGYQLHIFYREDFASSAKLQRVLRNRGITDVILGAAYEKSLAVELDWSKFIGVQLLTAGFFQPPLHTVSRDHFNSVILAWNKAVSRGYTRVGISLLEHPMRLVDDVSCSSAVRTCQMDLFPHLPALPPFRYPRRNFTREQENAAFVRWIEENQPDVIIGFTLGNYFLHQEKFGHKLAFVNLHRQTVCETSGIREDVEQCAREAVNLLHFCRRTYQWGIPKIRIDHMLEPRWSEGHSLPPKGVPIPMGPLTPIAGED